MDSYRIIETIRGEAGDYTQEWARNPAHEHEVELETLEAAIEQADRQTSQSGRQHVDVVDSAGFCCYRVSWDGGYRKREYFYLQGVDVVIESTWPRLRPSAFA